MFKKGNEIFLIDTNVIIDVLCKREDELSEWSERALESCAEKGELAINQIIYTEVSVKFDNVKELDRCLINFNKISLPWPAGFIAGKTYLTYKKNKGGGSTPLPDFYIGAHALYSRYTLVSRDKRNYSQYFPGLQLIAP